MSSANFKLKRTAAASRGFLATARFSCMFFFYVYELCLSATMLLNEYDDDDELTSCKILNVCKDIKLIIEIIGHIYQQRIHNTCTTYKDNSAAQVKQWMMIWKALLPVCEWMKQHQHWLQRVLCGCQPISCLEDGPLDAAWSNEKVVSQWTQADRIRPSIAVRHAAVVATCSQQQSPAELQAPTCADNSHGRMWTARDDCLLTLPAKEPWSHHRNLDFCLTDNTNCCTDSAIKHCK